MPYLVQIYAPDDSTPDVEFYDDQSKSIRQVLDALAARPEADALAGKEVTVWTVTGPGRKFTAARDVRFVSGEDGSDD